MQDIFSSLKCLTPEEADNCGCLTLPRDALRLGAEQAFSRQRGGGVKTDNTGSTLTGNNIILTSGGEIEEVTGSGQSKDNSKKSKTTP